MLDIKVETIFALMLCLIFGSIFIGLFIVLISKSVQSRLRFVKNLKSMSNDEQIQFAEKGSRFTFAWIIGLVIGALGIFVSLVFEQENITQYFCYGIFIYIFITALISTFVFRVPKSK